MIGALFRKLSSWIPRRSRPEFDALLRAAMEEPLVLLSPLALERSLETNEHTFQTNPQ